MRCCAWRCGDTLIGMSPFFKRLHNRQEPPGIELVLLRKMPFTLLVATLVPLALSALVRVWPWAEPGIDIAKRITSIDIFVIASIVTLWTAVLTVSIGCFIVFVMKGPGYVADAYPLKDAARPGRGAFGHRLQNRTDTSNPTFAGRRNGESAES